MAKKTLINLIFITLILISISLTFYGGYISYYSTSKKENISTSIETSITNISNNVSNIFEDKTIKENENYKIEINENSIGVIIFENGKSIPIYNNPTDYNMEIGIGKLNNNSILNKKGNNILLGHNPGNFSILSSVKIGDTLKIKSNENSLEYRVTEVNITEKDDPTPYKSTNELTLTLITCYPNNNSKRIVVIAKVI